MTKKGYYRLLGEYQRILTKEEFHKSFWVRKRLAVIQSKLVVQCKFSTHLISDRVLSIGSVSMNELLDLGNRIYELQRKLERGLVISSADYEDTYLSKDMLR